ncbi:MAG TPA: hypothetical protein VIY49_38165 [Bryobacteraceae bacterium]
MTSKLIPLYDCVVRGNGELVDGHLRLKAARKLRLAKIPVILCNEWTAAQVKALRLLVNRSATFLERAQAHSLCAWAGWDPELLTLELQKLERARYDLSLTGFDTAQLDELLRSERSSLMRTTHSLCAWTIVDTAEAAPPAPEAPVPQVCGCRGTALADADGTAGHARRRRPDL